MDTTTHTAAHAAPTTALSHSDIIARLNELGDVASERMRLCAADFSCTVGGAEIDFMTPEERAERHTLMLQLPSYREEAQAARARLQERIAQRRKPTTVTATQPHQGDQP